MNSIDYSTATYVGLASIAGLYLARSLKSGTKTPLTWTQLGMVGVTSAGSAVVAPKVTSMLVCPHSPGAPLVESVASAGVAYGVMVALGDSTNAMMFVPVQIGAYLAGTWTSRWMKNRALQAEAQSQATEETAPLGM